MSEQIRECTCGSEFAHEPWCMLHESPAKRDNDAICCISEKMKLCKDLAAAREEIERLKKELDEQARVNGMGGERELKLLSELANLKAENEAMSVDWIEDKQTIQQLRRENDELREALRAVVHRYENYGGDARKNGVSLGLYAVCKNALDTCHKTEQVTQDATQSVVLDAGKE